MPPQAPPTHNQMDQRGTTTQPQLGQSHTAEGELDLSAIYVIHHALRRDLRDFDLAVPVTPLADTASWAALRRRWLDGQRHGLAHTTPRIHCVERGRRAGTRRGVHGLPEPALDGRAGQSHLGLLLR